MLRQNIFKLFYRYRPYCWSPKMHWLLDNSAFVGLKRDQISSLFIPTMQHYPIISAMTMHFWGSLKCGKLRVDFGCTILQQKSKVNQPWLTLCGIQERPTTTSQQWRESYRNRDVSYKAIRQQNTAGSQNKKSYKKCTVTNDRNHCAPRKSKNSKNKTKWPTTSAQQVIEITVHLCVRPCIFPLHVCLEYSRYPSVPVLWSLMCSVSSSVRSTIKVACSATVTCSDLLENDIKCVYWQDSPTCQVSIFSKKPFLSNGILCYPKSPLTYCVLGFGTQPNSPYLLFFWKHD